jgi:CelD/BcsL family acetyltransferase involved in cellulose biosynthesis
MGGENVPIWKRTALEAVRFSFLWPAGTGIYGKGMIMNIELVTTHEQFKQLAPVWNETLAVSDIDIPFMTFEWFSSWWEVYGKKNDLLIFVFREAGEIVALAPLLRTKGTFMGLPVRIIGFIDNNHAARVGLIVRKEVPGLMHALLEYLRRSQYRYDLVVFNAVEKNSATERYLRNTLAAHAMPCIMAKGKDSPYIRVEGTWEDYYKSRSKNVRHKLNRIGNALKRQGPYEIADYTGKDLDRGVAEMLAISRHSWKYANKTAIISNRDNIVFFSRLANVMAVRGWFRLWVLMINNEPAAFQYALQYKGKLYGIKTDFDEKFSAVCPGKILAKHIVQRCFEEGLKEFDLLGQNESYKMEWTSLCREHFKYMAFNTNAYGMLLYQMKTKVISRLKTLMPAIFTASRKNAFARTRGELQE